MSDQPEQDRTAVILALISLRGRLSDEEYERAASALLGGDDSPEDDADAASH